MDEMGKGVKGGNDVSDEAKEAKKINLRMTEGYNVE